MSETNDEKTIDPEEETRKKKEEERKRFEAALEAARPQEARGKLESQIGFDSEDPKLWRSRW